MADVPADDPTTVPNESIEYLKVYGRKLFDTLLLGPFEFGGTNGACPLIIPFSLVSGKLENFIFATDGAAKSNPMLLNCPSNVVVNCGQPVNYGQLSYAACGDVSIAYNPPAGSAFPVGTTPVTVTLSDTNGNSTNCTFTVTVVDNSTPTVPSLAVLTGQCSVQVPTPTATNICGITTNIVTGKTSDPLTYTSQGTNIVHWSFNDGNGNIATANQTVIVKDTTPPATPSLPTVTGTCSAPVILTPPTTTDNCAGTVTGTTTDPTNYTTTGTFTVHWTFNDGNGNTSTANQTVIVVDNSTPTVPSLPVLTGQCSVQVPTPTATSICGTTTNIVTGTTSDPLTYTGQGTNIVHWSFNDGNGNIATANQTVIVKDTTPPATPSLPTITGDCSAPVTLTPPTTTDNCAGTVTGTTTDPTNYTQTGTFTVHWTFNDGNGNTSTANQTVIVGGGLTFQGFYSPIGTVSNLCASPVIVNQGSVLPIKFDMLCGSTPITAGPAPIVKIQLWTGCAFVSEPISVDAVYQNNWHFNWDTTGWAKGIYKVVVILPDGTSQYVFVRLK
jgi:hypothetical protein